MAKFYSKERSKYGNLTGQIIIWPVEYTGEPDEGFNPENLPAGYLKCDGSKYLADDYPQLAAILGTGTNTTFKKTNLDGSDFEIVSDTQFVVPDLGSKYPEPTSGANTGVYNSIRKENKEGVEKSRSGLGIEATVTQGTNGVIPLTYSGTIVVPSQEIPIPGKPSYQYGSATHYTESVAVEDVAMHPHAHFHSGVKPRTMEKGNNVTNDTPALYGYTGRWTASTINIEDWLDNTRYTQSPNQSQTFYDNGGADEENNDHGAQGNADGLGQNTCKAITGFAPNGPGIPVFENPPISSTVYWGGCILGYGLTEYKYGCILNKDTKIDRAETFGSANGINTTYFMQTFTILPFFIGCNMLMGQNDTRMQGLTAEIIESPTYVAGAVGVPVDSNNVSLADVLPLNSEGGVTERRAIMAVNSELSETVGLTQDSGDPTTHTHRIRLEPDSNTNSGNHSYKVKTRALELEPENLKTTITVGEDASHSIDSATQPFIIMEYLIKV